MKTMTAIEIVQPGAPDVLHATVRPLPEVKAGEVLIRVAFAGVNRPDIAQRQGFYPPPPGASDIPGLEVAGDVVAVGAGVDATHLGARVCALVAGGGYAQYVAAPWVQCLPVPQGMSLEQAAVLPETFFTVYLNVFVRAELAPGETLLVHGGSSGIGSTAILMAKALGSAVIATAGSEGKCEACRALGADVAINYRTSDFVAVTRAHTAERGADVILDMVGGSYLARNIAAAAVEGRISVIATLGGAKAELDLRELMKKRLKLMASTLRPQSIENKARLAAALRERIWPLLASQALLPPPIYARFALEQAADAHTLMESSEHIGKIVLAVS